MTTDLGDAAADTPAAGQSTLQFDPVEMLRAGARVNMAVFARLMGVSRQAASEWKRKGLVTLGPDGLVDPAVAARQLMRNADPTRLRAKVLRAAAGDTAQQLRAAQQRIADLEAQLAAERRHCAQQHIAEDALAKDLQALLVAIEGDFPRLTAAAAAGRLAIELDAMAGTHVWHLSEADIAEMLAEADDDADDGAE